MKRIALVFSAAMGAALLLGGCSVGKGVGAAKGKIFELGCSKAGDYASTAGVIGTPTAPADYDLQPSFFAGEPIDDLRQSSNTSAIMNNRLTIRLQRSGKQIENNDVLTFDIASSYEVARCVRGHYNADGTPDWDTQNCYRASDSGPGRMRVQWDSPVHASLSLKSTCTVNIVASAVSAPVPVNYNNASAPVVTDGNWSSWVEFTEFGLASRPKGVDAGDGGPISNKFRIELGDRIWANAFFLTFEDDQIVSAARTGLPRPSARIGGTLGTPDGDPTMGRFDFDIARGQGAQFFP